MKSFIDAALPLSYNLVKYVIFGRRAMNRIPFDMTELENATESTGFMGMVVKTYATPITPKENYRLIYERKLPLWMPLSGDLRFFIPRVDPDNVARCFIFEANMLTPDEMVGGPDKFGIEWIYVPVAGGSMVKARQPDFKRCKRLESRYKFPGYRDVGTGQAPKHPTQTMLVPTNSFLSQFCPASLNGSYPLWILKTPLLRLLTKTKRQRYTSCFAP